MKFCKDCKWSIAPGTMWVNEGPKYTVETIKLWTCTRPETDVVTGETTPTKHYCYDLRLSHSLLCGAEGRWFEPKEQK